jgi:hypothetical protein
MFDWFGSIGILVSALGFGATLWQVRRSRNAALAARAAANEARDTVRLYDTLSDLSQALAIMDEAKRLNRAKRWEVLLDRYALAKKLLVHMKAQNPSLGHQHTQAIASTISQLGTLEDVLEQALQDGSDPTKRVAHFNSILSKQIERLDGLLAEVKASPDRRQ